MTLSRGCDDKVTKGQRNVDDPIWKIKIGLFYLCTVLIFCVRAFVMCDHLLQNIKHFNVVVFVQCSLQTFPCYTPSVTAVLLQIIS